MTQPPIDRAAQGQLLADHSRCTNIQGRGPGLKVKPPPLRRVDRADKLVALATQDCHPSQAKQQPYPVKLLPTMVPEAAASTHKHHLLGAATPTSTNLTTRETQSQATTEQGLQDDTFMEDTT
jgi:hypothetical protein